MPQNFELSPNQPLAESAQVFDAKTSQDETLIPSLIRQAIKESFGQFFEAQHLKHVMLEATELASNCLRNDGQIALIPYEDRLQILTMNNNGPNRPNPPSKNKGLLRTKQEIDQALDNFDQASISLGGLNAVVERLDEHGRGINLVTELCHKDNDSFIHEDDYSAASVCCRYDKMIV